MNMREIEKQLRSHPVIRSEMAACMQMGFPFLYQDQGKLCLRYFPHKQEVLGGKIIFHKPAYHLQLCYPFRHFIHFSNLVLSGEAAADETAAQLDARWMFENTRQEVARLYTTCDAVLAEQQAHSKVSPETMELHQQAFAALVKKMRLEGVYRR